MRQISVDKFFLVFFGRGGQFNDICSQSAYLDLETGDVLQLFADDRAGEQNFGVAALENQAVRERVRAAPRRYLEIPGLDRANHHEILKAFLDSEWTGEKAVRERAQTAFEGSIGDWIGALGCDAEAVRAYSRFRDAKVEERAKEFLADKGVDPVWR